MPEPKTVVESALSTAMMVAFTIPEGAPVGAVLAVLDFVVGLVWPDGNGQIPSQFRTVTVQELDNVKTELIQAIDEALDKAQIKAKSSQIFDYTSGLCDNFEQMMKVKIDSKGYEFVQDSSGKDYIADADKYFNWLDQQSVYHLANAIRNDLAQSASSPSKTFQLYALIGSLMVSYLKETVTWQWGKEVRGSLLYRDYWIALEKWNKRSLADRTAHPAEEPVKPDTSLSNPLPNWQDWRGESGVAADKLVATVNMLIKECEGDGKYAKLKANWDDRNTQILPPAYSQITLNNGTNAFGAKTFYVEDSESGTQTESDVGDATMQWAMFDLMVGSKIAYQWQKYTDLYDLDGVKEDDINAFYETVKVWKQVRDTMLFQTATVDPGISLVDVARTNFYTDDDLFYYVLRANPFTLSDTALIDKDQVLTIPDLTDKAFAPTSYTVQTGDTLASIAKAKLGDASYAVNIFAANAPLLKPKLIKTGEQVAIPNLTDGSLWKPGTTFLQTYTFQAGDTWQSLTKAAYSDADILALITNANSKALNPSLILPDQVVKFPDLPLAPVVWFPPGPADPDDPENPANWPNPFGN